MARTDDQRYQQALAHVKKIDAQLAADIDTKVGTDAKKVGAVLSLEGAGYWKSGTADQHTAVRALLLCQVAYFRPPHAPQEYASPFVLGLTRTNCRNKSLAQLNEEIGYYCVKPAMLEDMADAAVRIRDLTGTVDNLVRKRTDTNVSTTPVCYHGVVSWMFSSGVVSKRWLAREGNDLTANKVNDHIGDGQIVARAYWDTIPRGYIWNIHRDGDKTTCHWGVSLGGGVSVACNNTDESPFKKLAYINDGGGGEPGSTKYGKFRMTDICEVLNGTVKYGHSGATAPTGTNIVVRQLNPLYVASYY